MTTHCSFGTAPDAIDTPQIVFLAPLLPMLSTGSQHSYQTTMKKEVIELLSLHSP
jgi:hypothetical protein